MPSCTLDVRCERGVELGKTFHTGGVETCSATLPSGAGFGRGSAFGSTHGPPAWSLVEAGDDQFRLGPIWNLWVEARGMLGGRTDS